MTQSPIGEHFGVSQRPGSGRGSGTSAYPQVRMAALVEIGSHAVLDAELAGCRTGEVTLVGRLPRSAGPGQLVLADREFLGVPLWQAFAATGAGLLWRVPANRVLPVIKQFCDGSWLSHLRASSGPAGDEPVVVRVLAYRLEGRSADGESDGYRLVTALLDARRVRRGNWPRGGSGEEQRQHPHRCEADDAHDRLHGHVGLGCLSDGHPESLLDEPEA